MIAALIASIGGAAEAAGLEPWAQLLVAAGLLLLAAGLLLLELMVVSFGLLTVAAAVAAYASCAVAWHVSPIAGWIFIGVCPLAAAAVLRVGLRWVQRSRMVPKDEITGHAGYAHAAEELGVAPGAVGELVTDAMPTGRARFAKGELDVMVEGMTLPRGARVTVVRIDGASIHVIASDPNAHRK